jgi:hypothetical protein
MAIPVQPPETDLFVPLPPEGAGWDPYTIHTHYFGFSVPERALGGFIYVRYQPAFPLSQGGVCVFHGLDNAQPLDMAFMDYRITMPWPRIEGATITTDNGLRIEFLEPGRRARVSFASADGRLSLDLLQSAVTPLFARGHVVPGEELHHAGAGTPGGSEQFMHCTGEVVLNGERLAIDCYAPRDRSWCQLRAEPQGGAVPMPAIGWSPMYFGEELAFNQVGIEAPDADPAWAGSFEVPAGRPTHHFAWCYENGETRAVKRVRRAVLAYHPVLHAALRQEIEAETEDGEVRRFRGEAIAMTAMPAWPNVGFCDSVYRWEDEHGRVTHATYQELWADRYQRAVRLRLSR